jgi:glycosyltransferase involved in cell wall biosynthesis
MGKPHKVFYFLSHPIQYFSPLLRELAVHTQLEVFYLSDSSIKGAFDKEFGQQVKWDIPLLEGYKYHFLKNYSSSNAPDNRLFDVFNPGVIKVLARKGPAILIVNGWSYSTNLLIILLGPLFGKKIWLRAENPLNQELRKSKKVLFLKKIFLKFFLFRFVNRFLYIGSENREFFKYYGAKDAQLIYTPYAVDNDWFQQAAAERASRVENIRQQLGIKPGMKVILFSGKYIDKKRPLDLLKAFHQLNDDNSCLVMVGEGALREEMEQYINENKVRNVMLTGFVNQTAIPDYYAIADVFVMSSGMGETWGLSVNEAMNFKKPVIVSRTCGCSADLVKPAENGFVYEEGNIGELVNCLQKILNDHEFRCRAGDRSGEIIRQFSIQKIAKNITAAAEQL